MKERVTRWVKECVKRREKINEGRKWEKQVNATKENSRKRKNYGRKTRNRELEDERCRRKVNAEEKMGGDGRK